MLKVYPRVKVREEEEEKDQYDFEMRSLQSMKGLQFISLDDLSSPDDSPTSVVRVPRLSSSSSATPSASALKGETREKTQNDPENNKTNVRAGHVPRPRAVLSSRDNDGIITHNYKLNGLKSHDLCQNRHLQCNKALPVAANISVRVRRELREVTDSTLEVPSRRRVVTADPIKRGDKPKLVQSMESGKPAITKHQPFGSS